MPIISYSAIFNGTDLTSITGVTVLKTTPYQPAKRSIASENIIRTDKSRVTGVFYTQKEIVVRVAVSRNSRDLVETSWDSLLALVQGVDKELRLRQSGGSRKYTCTLADVIIDVEGGMYLEADLIFSCSDRFGYDIASTLLLNMTAYTSAQRSDGLTFGGNAPWQAPVITITYSAVSGGANKTVTIGNSNTGQRVSITATFVAGSVIVVDCLNKTITVNGVEVAPVGAIPEWEIGAGWWDYSDTFTSRTFTGNIRHVRRWV